MRHDVELGPRAPSLTATPALFSHSRPLVAAASGGVDPNLQLSIVLRALQIEAERPTVVVRQWSRPGSYMTKLYNDFNSVARVAAAVAKVPEAKVQLFLFRRPRHSCKPHSD